MPKKLLLPCLLFLSALSLNGAVWAQPVVTASASDAELKIVKSSVNAESDNAELCLEFDKPLANAPTARLLADLHLNENGKSIVPQNIVPTASSLCLFPLDRGTPYQLSLNGLKGAHGEKLSAPYHLSFTIPDRSPLLAFTGINGGAGGFGAYESALTLRAVNVDQAKIEIYRVTDIPTMAHIWQDRTQTVLAPSESAYLARSKGQLVWSDSHATFDHTPNAVIEQKISLRDRVPDLAPGLYLIIADAGKDMTNDKPANKGLAPLAAAWFTKSDFVLQALRDGDGVHVVASTANAAKVNLRLIAMNRQSEQVGELQSDTNGLGLFAPSVDANVVIGIDGANNVSFTDVKSLPTSISAHLPGAIDSDVAYPSPGAPVDVALSLSGNSDATPTFIRLLRNQNFYADFPVPVLGKTGATVSFTAPVALDSWSLHWQKNDGTVLATEPLLVTDNPDAPHLTLTTDNEALSSQNAPDMLVNAVTSTGKPAGLVSGHVTVAWQARDPAAAGWKNYRFGTQAEVVSALTQSVDFLTDQDGTAQVKLATPKLPPEPGLYQIAITATAEPDQGVVNAPTVVLPLKADNTVIGIKPQATDARFFQNSIARFALIGIGADDKPRDISGLSYQIYEEGRSFDWYQDDGKWNYKREPQLRPIGGGGVAIKADGSSILEWPVTAGNYRLVIVDANGKILAQSHFSAGWNSAPRDAVSTSLVITVPASVETGHEAVAHFSLPTQAMVTAVIADTHIRKIIHELRPKGDNSISFTPLPDWQSNVSVSIEATAAGQDSMLTAMQGTAQTSFKVAPNVPTIETGVTLTMASAPAALIMREGNLATMNFGIQNRGSEDEVFHYVVTASPGLKIESDSNGTITLGGRQSIAVPVLVAGDTVSAKEIRLEVSGAHMPRVTRAWPMAVVSKNDVLRTVSASEIAPQQALITPNAKMQGASIALIARHSMQGAPEILTYLFNAHPFTTRELALSVDALHSWNNILVQTGIAPDFAIAARKQEWLRQLLQHQNEDGGFSTMRDSESTMEDTATALLALGPDNSELVLPAKTLAVAWLKQRLDNTWFDEKERTPRATAFAGLVAADAIDPAALHYFSDISAQLPMDARAEANMAAAFKHIRDPNAAAFWIKKMLDEHGRVGTVDLLNALASTDALPSDDVLAALKTMADGLHARQAPDVEDAASLLRALAADNVNAGRWRLTMGNQSHDITGAYAIRLSDPTLPLLHNGDAQPLSVTMAAETIAPVYALPKGSEITRHIYRLNGVELSSSTKPVHSETYIIELAGKLPNSQDGGILLQDDANNGIRPVGCALSNKVDAPFFAPLFVPHDLSPLAHCEKTAYGVNVVLAPSDKDSDVLKVVYFARIDAKSVAALLPPQMRFIK